MSTAVFGPLSDNVGRQRLARLLTSLTTEVLPLLQQQVQALLAPSSERPQTPPLKRIFGEMLFRDDCAQGQSRSLTQVSPQRPPRTSPSKRTTSMPSWVPPFPPPTTPSPGCGTAEISVPDSEPGNSWSSFQSDSQAVPSPPHPHGAESTAAGGSIWATRPRVSFPRNLGD